MAGVSRRLLGDAMPAEAGLCCDGTMTRHEWCTAFATDVVVGTDTEVPEMLAKAFAATEWGAQSAG
jgi:hypothetical protein